MILDSIIEAVGKTPLLRLRRFAPDKNLLAKLELFNPYSIKDRPVLEMIRGAEKFGKLKPGGTVVEATSGNTGMALAMVCAVHGYKCVLVMSEIQSVERRQILQALGAELILTPRDGGTKAAREKAKEIAHDTGALYIGQHDNPANPGAHQATTAEELWNDTGGAIGALVGGSLSAIIGLVMVLNNHDDPGAYGPGLALMLLGFLWGVFLSYAILLPLQAGIERRLIDVEGEPVESSETALDLLVFCGGLLICISFYVILKAAFPA